MTLHSCWAKVERAKEHCDALNAAVAEIFSVEANIPILGTRAESQGDGLYKNIVYVSHASDLSVPLARVGLTLGDAIHNLRSALDHLAYGLSISNKANLTQAEERTIYFPICGDASDWGRKVETDLRFVGGTDRDIIRRHQPYLRPDSIAVSNAPVGFHPLLALHRLDIIDKHRLIPTIVTDAGVSAATPLI